MEVTCFVGSAFSNPQSILDECSKILPLPVPPIHFTISAERARGFDAPLF
jgi:hypothetical protein